MGLQPTSVATRTTPAAAGRSAPSSLVSAATLALVASLASLTSLATGCNTRVIEVRDHDPLFDGDDGRRGDADRDGKQRLRRNVSPPQRPGPPPVAEVDPAQRPDAWRHGVGRDGVGRDGVGRDGVEIPPTVRAILDEAEAQASPEGRQVLQTGRAMVEQGQIVVGSCWTFATAVYQQAGFEGRRRQRVHRGRKSGPYVDPAEFQPGDFLSYVNHSYNGSEHSAIFVAWLDRERVEALMLSYVGSHRQVPGGYRSYLLTHVYAVMRPKP